MHIPNTYNKRILVLNKQYKLFIQEQKQFIIVN